MYSRKSSFFPGASWSAHTYTYITTYPVFFPKTLKAIPCESTQWSEATPAQSCDPRILPHQAPDGPCPASPPLTILSQGTGFQDLRDLRCGWDTNAIRRGLDSVGDTGLRGQKSRTGWDQRALQPSPPPPGMGLDLGQGSGPH